ncbi:glycosyltransferase [Chloroflexus aggregans]|uniref:Glycosyl transferase family 2 n=1 Tax=Chloroflexus aggregans (strain MD-66 / DSM 9485) TaxID=326427 RepID=B8GAU2_CHLAD|nr:glycosyltransferase [Chloroflexus aggregans]ACL24681.1 glycosyl transferase family 2 [Chloroflexus aggregans DSM 9485]
MQQHTVSIICTVRDEADNIAALLDSMLMQTRTADEIVINDCQSVDETPAIVAAYAARYPQIKLVRGGHNISSGRNNAIRHARGPLIASTDAGLILDPHWLARIIAPLETGDADLVGGFFHPTPRSLFALALGETNYRRSSEIDPLAFLPFGKSMAFRKEVWEAVGGFPEWASHCEDLLFDLAVERAGFRRVFVPEAVVHFAPRSTLRAFIRQYYLYARGDGRAGLWSQRHALRYAVYLTLSGLMGIALNQPRLRAPIGALIGLGVAAYTRGPYRRLWPKLRGRPLGERLFALALVPLIRLVGDVAKMVGYPVGLWRRLQHNGRAAG